MKHENISLNSLKNLNVSFHILTYSLLYFYFVLKYAPDLWGFFFVRFTREEQTVICRGKEYFSITVSRNFSRRTVLPIALFNPICFVPFAFVFSSVVIFKPIILFSLALTGSVRHVCCSVYTVVKTNSTGPSRLANKDSVVRIMIECTHTSVVRIDTHIHPHPNSIRLKM